jgi:glutathionylspermidine synthase
MEYNEESVTLSFECGCFVSYFVVNEKMMGGLACCSKHEAPYQQLKNILPLTLVDIKHDEKEKVMNITVNGDKFEYTKENLTYEDAVELAGFKANKGWIYTVVVKPVGLDGRILFPNGGFIRASDGMHVNVANTSNA